MSKGSNPMMEKSLIIRVQKNQINFLSLFSRLVSGAKSEQFLVLKLAVI
jgi:hypothetical protein